MSLLNESTLLTTASTSSEAPGGQAFDDFEKGFKNLTRALDDRFPDINFKDIPGLDNNEEATGANFLLFMCSLVFGVIWITYITFFNSRVVGKIVTRVVNRFVADGYVKVRFSILIA